MSASTTVTTNSAPSPTAIDNRLKRDRSFKSGAHNGSISKSIKTTKGKNSLGVTQPQQNEIPIFLLKTYAMISECDPTLAEWTPDGDNFVVKNPTQFAEKVIPNYFDHKNFASFARQLNFYGFHKVQVKPVRNTDIDKSTANYVTFRNENFKRDRKDLLSNIQRSTRGGGNAGNLQNQQRQIDLLKAEVKSYEIQVAQLTNRMNLMDKQFSDLVEQLKFSQPQHAQGINPRVKIDVEDISRQFSLTSLTGDIFDKGARKLQPTSEPHPNAKNKLPPSSIRPLYKDPSSLSLGDSGYILDGLIDTSGNDKWMDSNSSRKSSQPTLKPHPKAKNNLPPGDAPSFLQEPPPRSLSLGISEFRGLSNDSFGLDTFEKGFLKAIVLDGEDNNRDGIEPNDDLWNTATQNV